MDILEALNISLTGFVVVLIILALLAVIIVMLSKVIRVVENVGNNKEEKEVEETSPVVSAPAVSPTTNVTSAPAPIVYQGGVELYKTDLKSAATIMAIVSHESGIPLNRLQFTSIRLVDDVDLYETDDKTAATIMAIVSHQSGIPLDRLVFKSIKLIEK